VAGAIDPLSNLKGARVWVYSATGDSVVKPVVGREAAEFYRMFVEDEQVIKGES
jgi:hypothetical protein